MWEKIPEPTNDDENTYIASYRLKVVGGWIVRTITSRYYAGAGVAHTFIVDPQHTWQLEQPKAQS